MNALTGNALAGSELFNGFPVSIKQGETIIENRVFVGGIPPHTTETELKVFFVEKLDKYGIKIKDVKIIADRTGISKGYGFITLETRDQAQRILSDPEFENLIFKERKLNISKAVKKHVMQGRSDLGAAMISNAAAAPSSSYLVYPGSQDALAYNPSYVLMPPYYGQLICSPTGYQTAAAGYTAALAGQTAIPASSVSSVVSQGAANSNGTTAGQNVGQAAALPWSPIPAPYLTSPNAAAAQHHAFLANEFLYPAYSPQSFSSCYGSSATTANTSADYSTNSDNPSSIDTGIESDSSPSAAGNNGSCKNPAECFSPGSMMPYASPVMPYPLKMHNMQYLQAAAAQNQRLLMPANNNGQIRDVGSS